MNTLSEAAMRRAQTKQTLKLRLLALVLSLALIWYSLNPMPTPIIHRKRDDELPDEKKRNLESHNMPRALSLAFEPIRGMAEPLTAPDQEEDDFEWPDFIDG